MYSARVDHWYIGVSHPMASFDGEFIAPDIAKLADDICKQYFTPGGEIVEVEYLASDSRPVDGEHLAAFNRLIRLQWEDMLEEWTDDNEYSHRHGHSYSTHIH